MKQKMLHIEHGSSKFINRLNKINVLGLIRHEREISRAEIVKRTGLSAPTVTRIVDSLINEDGLVLVGGTGESTGGRPPVMVHFNAVDNYVVGLDWGRTHIQLVLADLDARIVADLDEPVFSETDFDADTQLVIDCINRIIGASGIPPEKILGIGVAAAGYVSSKTGVIEFSPNFGWHHADISKALGQAFDKPVKVDNVSRVMAMGELCYGLGQTIDSYLFVNIGYGIGSGIVVDGKPMTGFDGYSGEIGHTRFYKPQLAGEDRKCVCGKTNCLECFASGRGIAETAIKNACHFPDSMIHQLCGGKRSAITTEMLARAARAGDSFALDIFNESAEMIGLALANYSNAFNPQAVVIGGKVAQAGSFFHDRIRHVFESERLQHVSRPVDLHFSSIPGKEAVKGAVALVLQEVLELKLINTTK